MPPLPWSPLDAERDADGEGSTAAEGPTLLAVDLGLRTGLAVYGTEGRLRRYHSQNYGTRTRLKAAVYEQVRGHALVVAEGSRDLALVWHRAAASAGARFYTTSPRRWRQALLLPREYRSGAAAKAHAETLARAVITWSGLPGPTALRHDAAEAILIGLWAVLNEGWLATLPSELARGR